jgi:hypothetical protein
MVLSLLVYKLGFDLSYDTDGRRLTPRTSVQPLGLPAQAGVVRHTGNQVLCLYLTPPVGAGAAKFLGRKFPRRSCQGFSCVNG